MALLHPLFRKTAGASSGRWTGSSLVSRILLALFPVLQNQSKSIKAEGTMLSWLLNQVSTRTTFACYMCKADSDSDWASCLLFMNWGMKSSAPGQWQTVSQTHFFVCALSPQIMMNGLLGCPHFDRIETNSMFVSNSSIKKCTLKGNATFEIKPRYGPKWSVIFVAANIIRDYLNLRHFTLGTWEPLEI